MESAPGEGDGDGVGAPGNDAAVAGADGIKVSSMRLKEDAAAAESVASAVKTVVTIYEV